MSSRCFPGMVVLCMLAGGAAMSQEPASGWKRLFDGRSTKGWRGYRKAGFPERGWVAEDGCLHHRKGGGGGDILTAGRYGDFELRFEWKVAPGANSGVIYRVDEEHPATWHTGPEFQVLDDAGHAKARPDTTAGALYALYAAKGKVLKPAGTFNAGRIIVREGRIEHWVNGVRVVDCGLGDADWKARVARSKFGKMSSFGRVARGHIALQDHGDEIWYRNLRIREFSPGSAVKLFDGRSLAGWTHHLESGGRPGDTWSVTPGGVLVCKGRPAGYVRTTRKFTNFLLELEWRFDPVTKQAGNSGVLMRLTGQDKVWPRSLEAQLQSGNAGDFWRIDGFPLEAGPERTRGRRTARFAGQERPLGEWNHYAIELNGGDVELRVNGRVVNRGTGAEEVAGFIGLQSEGAPIHFRNIRLTPLAHGPGGPTR